jgi:catechol 2,3-dioxygenase-like lactoylglutathione lyase family enzyme
MDITIHTSVLPHDDPDASLAFYRDTLGFEVRNDVGDGKMRWIEVGPAGQPDTSISWRRRLSIPASPTTSAAPSPR